VDCDGEPRRAQNPAISRGRVPLVFPSPPGAAEERRGKSLEIA
jgi:hypothetical protein